MDKEGKARLRWVTVAHAAYGPHAARRRTRPRGEVQVLRRELRKTRGQQSLAKFASPDVCSNLKDGLHHLTDPIAVKDFVASGSFSRSIFREDDTPMVVTGHNCPRVYELSASAHGRRIIYTLRTVQQVGNR